MIEIIPLSKLKHSKLNVRKTGGKDIAELSASIRAIGLQQNLGVVQAAKGYEVVFGGRRLRALQQLDKAGELPEALAEGVPCTVLTAEEAHEASLAENTIREAMHPLDQFSAFVAMADAGKPEADIAAAFGVSELVVKQRMRLARVSPKLLKVYGDGGMTLQQLQAFAVSDDHGAQERVWKTSTHEYDRRPEELRAKLLREGVSGDDSRVQLVGLDAYETAGGGLRRDMFSEAVVILDEALLDRLVEGKLQEVVAHVKAEGWAWAEVGDRPSWNTPKIEPDSDPVDDWTATREQLDALEAAEEAGDWLGADGIEESLRTWPEGTKERAGAIVHLGPSGVSIYRGILREGEQPPESGTPDAGQPAPQRAGAAAKVEKDPAALPASQVFALTMLRTKELRKAMVLAPSKALVALTAHLAEDWRREHGAHSSGITIRHQNGPEVEGVDSQMAAELRAFKGPLLPWLAEQSTDNVLMVLALVTAQSLDLVQRYPNQKGLGDALCAFFELDMATRWRPDAEFLQKIPAAAILQALRESKVKNVDALAKLKKAELAGRAAELLRDKPWVPECLRLPAKPAKRDRKQIAAGDVD